MNYVICQSPKYLIASINKYKMIANCKLVIREVRGVYDFLIKYRIVIPEDLIFLPVYKRKSIFGLFANFIAIKKFCYECENDVGNVYVCTNEYDFTVISIVNRLVIRGRFYFEEFYSDGVERSNFAFFINKYLFGVKLHYKDNSQAYLPVNEKKIKIRSWMSSEKNKESEFLLKLHKGQSRQLLIVDSNDQCNKNLFNVEKIYAELITLCKVNNIQVIIKGHPRLGLSKCLENLKDKIYIQNNIPLEFIDTGGVDYICGFYSSALFNKSFNEKAKSFLMLSESKQESYYRGYLTSNGFDEKNFVSKVEDIIV